MYATDNATNISAFGLIFGLLMCLLMLVLPRRHAVVPIVALVCYMTMGQRILILDLNFTLIRLLVLFGFVRMLMRGEAQLDKPSPLDRAMVWWVVASIVTYTALWQTSSAFVNRLGLAYDALGLYFLFRVLVRNVDEMRFVVRLFALMVAPVAISMIVEKLSGQNPFAAFGGVPPNALVREGVIRCQGPFMHPILAGAFGSALLPLFVGLWWQRDGKRSTALIGIVSALVIVVTSGSSGPVMAAGAGVIALAMWPWRQHMRTVRWGLGLTVLTLHLVMAAPVWFLLARVGVFGGSTSYHRAILIDHAVNRFSEWWLVGTYSTAHWGYYMFDVTNQYVLIAVQGGLISLVLFIVIIVRGFGSAGRAVHAWESADRGEQRFLWALGASLLVHCFNYISVPYFDQNIVNWYLLLAMLATAGTLVPDGTAAEAAKPPDGIAGGTNPWRNRERRVTGRLDPAVSHQVGGHRC
ncbi:O-antigen ligase family protein [Rivibacter subsaxonicus]|uniref:O-antigen ligase n=1 Tax=Rivibacter subsaxonicus TaxID=457575 RepID=A0A4Q7VWW0_9BURK|nr:hypothetical protein [Rivibacter subsaxonicus]RZU00789.1 O-antigen ligase [Rivibacter subsaxonicus]